MRAPATLSLLALLILAPSTRLDHVTRADAQTPAISRTGTLGGARYQIEVPADWRGGLVVYAHGIQRGPGHGAVTLPPLATHILGEGYAWATSGYRAREYRPDLFVEDLIALRELALRRTADRVNEQMQDYRTEYAVSGNWATAERLLVCVGPSPTSARLIRSTSRMATTLRAPWKL